MALLVVPKWDPNDSWPTLGPQVCDLIEERMVFGPGSLGGEPAVLHDDWRAAIYALYEVYPRGHRWAGRRRFKRGSVSVRKGLAKALALDTPLPAESGWIRMGDVQPGDVLFDENGAPTRVRAVSETFHGHDCYRVTFKDGSSIVADGGHRWYTEELRHRYAGSVKTTEELARSVTVRADGARNHRIPVAKPLALPDADLPIDPWVLGAWLGDGRTNDAEFTMHAGDHPHFVERVEAAGYYHRPPKIDTRNGVYAVRVSSSPIRHGKRAAGDRTLKGDLRELGVLGRKHVPTSYLRASLRQRLALLQGLMDTDGSITPDGSAATFTSTVEAIALATYELMCSVGLKPTIKEFTTAAGTPAWKVYVYADRETPIFSLPRKAARQRAASGRTAMSRNRHIVSVEQVPSVPTRCIAVDSPSRLFLAGAAMVPTHNTELMAWIAQAELHPEGPVRCDGFDAYGEPVGRPVRMPYIPLLAVTVEQVEELAYGALHYMVTEGPDADLFDATLERIVRLGPGGAAEGKAVPLSNSPGSRDGARTTFQGFDEPHRLFLPRQRQAHETMLGNMSKRVLEDPWSLYVGTAGEPGQGSIAEDLHEETQAIAKGEEDADPRFFSFYRWAAGTYDLETKAGRIAAAEEATGPVGEFGPGQYEDIAANWTRKGADKQYLERVWLNRWVRSSEQAFDVNARADLELDRIIEPGAFVTVGFDGARFRDSTGFVLTEIATGLQQAHAVWEKPIDWDETHDEGWEIDEQEVDDALAEIMSTYEVWRGNCDPPHWNSTVNKWAGDYEQIEAWYTNRTRPMAFAVRNYREAMASGEVAFAKAHPLDGVFADHMAAAGRLDVNVWDDDPEAKEKGKRLFILRKLHPDRKFDLQMAAILSWEARLAALAAGAQPPKRRSTRVKRLR